MYGGGRDVVLVLVTQVRFEGGGMNFLLTLQTVPNGWSSICIVMLSFLFWKLARKSARRLC